MGDVAVATEVRRRVLASHDRFWTLDDFVGSVHAVSKALSRLVTAGDLRRIRRGLYWRGTPTLLGLAPPPADRLAHAVVDSPGVGPAGFSAALRLGLSTQVPRRDTVAIPIRVPRNPGPLTYVSRAGAVKRRDEKLRPEEVALLEVLRDWKTYIEVPSTVAVERISNLADTGALRVERLARASATEPAAVRDRLRRLLTDIGHADAAAIVRPARRGAPGDSKAA